MKRWKNRVASACAVIIGALVAVCPAECGETVAGSSLKIGDWNFAVLIDTNSATPRVTGLVGLRDHSTSVSGNLQSVWYSRPAAGSGDPWVCKTWMNANHWTAIATVKGNLNIPSDLDNLWPTDDVNSPEVQIEEPQPYKDGFLVDDPWGQWLAGEPGREWVIDWLKNSGYPVADVPFDIAGPGDCSAGTWLDAMAASAELMLGANGGTQESATAFLGMHAEMCSTFAAAPPAVITIGPYTGWTCGTPSSWSSPSHDTATGICTYTRTKTCQNCRTITTAGPNGTQVNTTQCVYYYVNQTDTCRQVNATTCPPTGINQGDCLPKGHPFTPPNPLPPDAFGPDPAIPGVPNTQPTPRVPDPSLI